MKWEGQGESSNVEDVRGMGGGGGGGFGIGGRGIGLGTVAVALVAGWIFGINPLTLLGMLSGGGGAAGRSSSRARRRRRPRTTRRRASSRTVLASTEDVWTEVFQRGRPHLPASPSWCCSAAAWPTACGQRPGGDGAVLLPRRPEGLHRPRASTTTLRSRLGAPGDFAQAYVIAHEVGHHVQNLLGIMRQGRRAARPRRRGAGATRSRVRVELQADCFAGVWAHASQQAQRLGLEPGDIEEALNAAVADRRRHAAAQVAAAVVPESFTHGTSAQRVGWFKRGVEAGERGPVRHLRGAPAVAKEMACAAW